MRKKKKTAPVLIPIITGVLLYIILAAAPLDRGLYIEPQWTLSITPNSATVLTPVTEGMELVPFKIGQRLGYVTAEGELVSTETFPFLGTISTSKWAVYGPQSRNISFYRAGGAVTGVVKGGGYPFFTEHGDFLMLPGGTSFTKLNDEGGDAWMYEGIAPITSFSATPCGTLTGYADGRLVHLDTGGNPVYTLYPGGSNQNVILGAALSETGTFSACVSGINDQRFVLFKHEDGAAKPVWHEYLAGSQREQVLVQFTKDENTVYYNEKGGLAITDTRTFNTTRIPLDGKTVTMVELPQQNLCVFLERGADGWSVVILENRTNLLGKFSFKAAHATLYALGDALYIGRDGTITKLEIHK